MQLPDKIDEALLRSWRHEFHQHPETAFEEHRTSARVAEILRAAGLEVTTGLAETGVIAVLDGKLGTGQ
ncbi:MAG: amidohydrolase, partial [Cobetia amphilecti]